MLLSSTTTRAITSAAARGPRIPIWSSRSSTVTILRPARARTALPICNLRNIVPGARFAATTTGTAATAQPFDISSNMASAKKIQLSPQTDTGVWSTGVVEDSARTASEVLQEDLEKHHVYFNDMGFHSMSNTASQQGQVLMRQTRPYRPPYPNNLRPRCIAK